MQHFDLQGVNKRMDPLPNYSLLSHFSWVFCYQQVKPKKTQFFGMPWECWEFKSKLLWLNLDLKLNNCIFHLFYVSFQYSWEICPNPNFPLFHWQKNVTFFIYCPNYATPCFKLIFMTGNPQLLRFWSFWISQIFVFWNLEFSCKFTFL